MGGVEFESSYVAIVLVFYCILNFWMGAQVGKARKQYKVPYPTLYASKSDNKDAKFFNYVQSGHQNLLELMPVFFMLMIVGGMRHPCMCAALGLVYTVTCCFYFNGDPQERLTLGKCGLLALMGLMFCTLPFGQCFLIISQQEPKLAG